MASPPLFQYPYLRQRWAGEDWRQSHKSFSTRVGRPVRRLIQRRLLSRWPRKGRTVWTVAQLQTFLQRARLIGSSRLWVLEATSGMRRCELAGARRDLLDLDAGTLAIETTRVVVDGRVIESDGKTENAQHVLALDPFTLAVLKAHVETLDQERREFGPDYHDHGVLFCWEDGRPPHPGHDHAAVQAAGRGGRPARDRPARREAQLRHRGPATRRSTGRRCSQRIGHADVAFTMKQYVQTDLEADRQVANTLAAADHRRLARLHRDRRPDGKSVTLDARHLRIG